MLLIVYLWSQNSSILLAHSSKTTSAILHRISFCQTVLMLSHSHNGLGLVSVSRLHELAYGNIEAIAILLGMKKFMFASDNLTFLDILVFSVLSQFLFVTPADNKLRKYVLKYQNLVDHHARIKKMVFPDWCDLTYSEC